MEIEYINDLKSNYLTSVYDGKEDDFSLIMITENKMPGCLECELRHMNGKAVLYYNISKLQSLKNLYFSKKMQKDQFEGLMQALIMLGDQLPEFFLPQKSIMLKPECIFWSLEKQEYVFLITPPEGVEGIDLPNFRELADFLVTVVDHEDQEFSERVYQFYEESYQDQLLLERYIVYDIPKALESESTWTTIENINYEEKDGITQDEEEEEQDQEEEHTAIPKGLPVLLLFVLLDVAVGLYLYRVSHEIRIISFCAIAAAAGTILFMVQLIREKRYKAKEVKENIDNKNKKELHQEIELKKDIFEKMEESKDNAEMSQTVYMDMNRQQERKLYGMGKYRRYKFLLNQLPYTIGKDDKLCECVINENTVSRMHARFVEENGEIALVDLNSTNGTFLNGLRLRPNQSVAIESEDEIIFGNVNFVYR